MTYNEFITGQFLRPINVKGFEERYLIDNKGNIYSFSSNKHLLPYKTNPESGLNNRVTLSKNGKTKAFHVLQLLAMTFPDVELPDDTYTKFDSRFGKRRGAYPYAFTTKKPWRAVISTGNVNTGKVTIGYYKTKDEAYTAFSVMYTLLNGRRPW